MSHLGTIVIENPGCVCDCAIDDVKWVEDLKILSRLCGKNSIRNSLVERSQRKFFFID